MILLVVYYYCYYYYCYYYYFGENDFEMQSVYVSMYGTINKL